MHDPAHPIVELLRKDRRYKYDAYVFVFDALKYAQTVLGLGTPRMSEPGPSVPREEEQGPQRHVSGRELCEAARRFALHQYGYMAKTVLNSWGIRSTADLGNLVFNLIGIGHMRKTAEDRREDFDSVYEFDAAFEDEFRFSVSE
jgi:uncharacterized repeat protein (TIGR04138 family)